jgi:predicted Fe-Mo cluster-binding NifX family protein
VNIRLAAPTKGRDGLEDVVSEVFGKAKTFTIVDLEKGDLENVKVLENPAVSYEDGAGPIVVKMLLDLNVNTVIAAEFGPGVSALLDQHNVKRIRMPAGRSFKKSIEDILDKLEK